MVENNGPKTVAAMWTMTIISLAFMALRFLCKMIHVRRLAADDALLLISWVFNCVYATLITISIGYGLGKHRGDIHPGDEASMYKFLFLGEFFTLIAIPTSKTSFAVTLLRLVTRTWQKWFIWFTIATMNIVMWLCALLLFFQCQPIQKNWHKTMSGHCWDGNVQDHYSIFAAAYSATLDFTLATIPCFIVWKLQLSVREKLGVIFAMSLGFLAGITAAVKMTFLPGIGRFSDPTFSLADLLILSHVETAVTIMAGSIPFFRVLVRQAINSGRSYHYRQGYRLESFGNVKRFERGQSLSRNDLAHESVLERVVPVPSAILRESKFTVEYYERSRGIGIIMS